MEWTVDQVLQLAPDPASAKAGKTLALARKWSSLGRTERAAWGECQGSGKAAYQTRIDLNEPAFKCSCPSRKFPCKHALGLFLLLVNQPELFAQLAPPAWVSDWLEGRQKRAEQRAGRKPRAEGVSDEKAQAKRAAERESKVSLGLDDLDLWLRDLVRQGLAWAQTQRPKFWETAAARMEDAQAPGLARMLQELPGVYSSGEGWQDRLLERLGRLHLLVEAYKRLDRLPEAVQADLRSAIGWTQSQDDLLAGPGVSDCWLVLGQRVEIEKKLQAQRTWLWGQLGGRAALVWQFAYGKQALDTSLVPGTALEAELAFYPSAYPLRALVKARQAVISQMDVTGGYETIAAAVEAYTVALSHNPWIRQFPWLLQNVVVTQQPGDRYGACDRAGHLVDLSPQFTHTYFDYGRGGWVLLALSGGQPLSLFGEWDGSSLLPLSAWADGRFVNF
ncbi:MAG: SWIM zinc finger family protein [Thermoflexales bacterium]|nr:SWIM zinc finger family protein [Thermoflexales bacterium]